MKSAEVGPVQRLPREWRRAPEIFRWRGPLRFLLLVAREILRPFMYWHVFYIVENDIRQSSPRSYARERFEVRIYVEQKDLKRAKTELSAIGELSPGEIRSRLGRGDAVAVAYAVDEAIGYSWMTFSSGLVLAFNTTWIVRANEAVLYDSFVLPQWRGQGIHSCLDVAFHSFARERGIVRTLASMAALNSQALSLAKRSGKPTIMTVVLVRVRGVKRTWGTAIGAPLNSRFQERSC